MWFIPYGEYEDGSTEPSNQGDDMYVIIPSSVTDDFTVTVNQVNGSGTVTIKVIMADIPSVAYFTASYDDYAADEDGNINIAHNVYVNEDYADKTDASKDYNLNVTAYDTDGEKIEGYSSYYVRLNSLNVTDGYHTSVDDEENCSGTVTRDGYAHWAVSIYDDTLTIDALYDTLDEYDGELLFSDDLTVTYEIEVCDEESNVTSKINVTVQITVPDVSNS